MAGHAPAISVCSAFERDFLASVATGRTLAPVFAWT
jgi:hypothetical protein